MLQTHSVPQRASPSPGETGRKQIENIGQGPTTSLCASWVGMSGEAGEGHPGQWMMALQHLEGLQGQGVTSSAQETQRRPEEETSVSGGSGDLCRAPPIPF